MALRAFPLVTRGAHPAGPVDTGTFVRIWAAGPVDMSVLIKGVPCVQLIDYVYPVDNLINVVDPCDHGVVGPKWPSIHIAPKPDNRGQGNLVTQIRTLGTGDSSPRPESPDPDQVLPFDIWSHGAVENRATRVPLLYVCPVFLCVL